MSNGPRPGRRRPCAATRLRPARRACRRAIQAGPRTGRRASGGGASRPSWSPGRRQLLRAVTSPRSRGTPGRVEALGLVALRCDQERTVRDQAKPCLDRPRELVERPQQDAVHLGTTRIRHRRLRAVISLRLSALEAPGVPARPSGWRHPRRVEHTRCKRARRRADERYASAGPHCRLPRSSRPPRSARMNSERDSERRAVRSATLLRCRLVRLGARA